MSRVVLIGLRIVLVLGGLAVVVFLAALIGAWWRGRQGLDQWPTPYGRYDDEWIGLKDVGDYYPWLAAKMGQCEPWAQWDAELNEPRRVRTMNNEHGSA